MKKYLIGIVFLISPVLYGADEQPTSGSSSFLDIELRSHIIALRKKRLAVLKEIEQLDYVRKDLYKMIKEGTLTREEIQQDLDNIDYQRKIKLEEYENLSREIEQVKSSLSLG